ncbi:hypothetical protein ANN_06433 [Periplaneta americana]|uniref:Uncharacterized protein n=1 Tax=Periplaneta americana TaxID=6978 RepID=A0ABQ8TFB9_PERAM|nr:hypothetical protein ANN_06433 [Periplaneta americana]
MEDWLLFSPKSIASKLGAAYTRIDYNCVDFKFPLAIYFIVTLEAHFVRRPRTQFKYRAWQCSICGGQRQDQRRTKEADTGACEVAYMHRGCTLVAKKKKTGPTLVANFRALFIQKHDRLVCSWKSRNTTVHRTGWKQVDSPPPKKLKTQPSWGKVMLSVFLGHPRCGADRLYSEWANHQRSILPKSPDEFTRGYQDEASREAVQGGPFAS